MKGLSCVVSRYVTNRILDMLGSHSPIGRVPSRQNAWQNRDTWWNAEEWKNKGRLEDEEGQ